MSAATAPPKPPVNAFARLDALAQAHPEWAPWLGVVRAVTADLPEPAWDQGPPDTAPPSALSPWLAGAVLRPDARAVASLLDRLSSVARAQGLHALAGEGKTDRHSEAPGEALAVFLAAVNGDDAELSRQASRRGASPDGFRALAQLLPLPYLHACARRWTASSARADWTQGYCPVCGAWPTFAEVRGIARSRHLRCGRCAASWAMPVLACTYCANTDHETLGTLVVVDEKTTRFSLDICRACSGYLKSCTTLQATPPDGLLVADLASVAFDLAAVERGYLRPPGPGVSLGATLAADLDAGNAAPRRAARWWS